MRRISPLLVFLLLWLVPVASVAQDVPFPGMSAQGYYASVTNF